MPAAGLASLAIHAVLLPTWWLSASAPPHVLPARGAEPGTVLSVRLAQPSSARAAATPIARAPTALEPVATPPAPEPLALEEFDDLAAEARAAEALAPRLALAWFAPAPLPTGLPRRPPRVLAAASPAPGRPRSVARAAVAQPLAAPSLVDGVDHTPPAPRPSSTSGDHGAERPLHPTGVAGLDAPPPGAAPRESPPDDEAPGVADVGALREARPLADNPAPRYPGLARRKGWEGTVVLAVAVDAQGRATAVEVSRSSGHAALDQAARRTVLDWRFLPAHERGHAVPGPAQVVIAFELRD